MPFELGLSVAAAKLDGAWDGWFVFETQNRRLQKSLSDLNGVDPHIHGGTPEGVMRELCNAFVRHDAPERYNIPSMMASYRLLLRQTSKILDKTGAQSLYEAQVFEMHCIAAGEAASRHFE